MYSIQHFVICYATLSSCISIFHHIHFFYMHYRFTILYINVCGNKCAWLKNVTQHAIINIHTYILILGLFHALNHYTKWLIISLVTFLICAVLFPTWSVLASYFILRLSQLCSCTATKAIRVSERQYDTTTQIDLEHHLHPLGGATLTQKFSRRPSFVLQLEAVT